MGVTLTDVLLFGKAQSDDVDNATLVIYRRNILRWSALGGYLDIIVKGVSPLNLPDAIANSLQYVKAFGGTEQRNIPSQYTQVNYVTNTAQTAVDTGVMIDFAKNYEFEVECRATTGSWYILQSRASSSGNITGIHGATSGSTITLVVGNVTVCTSAITRTVGNKLYVKATLNAGTATLYVKDETANTEDTQTGSYGTSQPNPTAAVYLLGNAGGQYADINSDIYMARIKENDTVVMDYVPARQVATAGFYDKASGTFKTALTPANLSADGNTVPTPDTPMDIVSNNGVLKVSKNLFDKNNITPINGYIAASGTTWTGSNNGYSLRIPCLPNTTYTARYNGNSTQAVLSFGSTSTDAVPVTGTDVTITQAIRQNNPTISTPITITTGANDKWLIVAYNKVEPQNTDMANNLQVEQGATATDYMPYGQIYTDGTVETISARGKNLLDMAAENVVVGKYISNSGVVTVSNLNFYNSKYIPVVAGGTYTWSTSSSVGYFSVMEYDSDYVFTQRTLFGSSDSPAGTAGTITLRNDTAFVLIGSNIDSTIVTRAKINAIDWQFEKGSTATDYVPYYDDVTATAEMLLKVGDYEDVQEILSGAITRKVGVKVLDGTENFETATATNCYSLTNTLGTGNFADRTIVCSHFASTPTMPGTGDRQGLAFIVNKGPEYTIAFGATTQFSTQALWQQFLADQYNAGTPVIIIYPLATPTTESVAGQTLQVTAGDNVLEITQASLNGLELEAQYQAAVQLTIQEVEDANLDNNVEVTIS